MTEGWFNDAYYVLFDQIEVADAGKAYGLDVYLPGVTVIGLKFWDDLLIRDGDGLVYSIPSVPLDRRHFRPEQSAVPAADLLKPDARLSGKVRWFVKPIVFGGDPKDDSNTTWVTLAQHAQMVRWWNGQYQAIKQRKE
jgi:hypothetical protein